MKNGTAMRLNESSDWNAICATISSDLSPDCKAMAADNPKAVMMGAPISMIAKKETPSTRIIMPPRRCS